MSSGAASAPGDLAWLEPYNVLWAAPSKNSSESTPCGGGYLLTPYKAWHLLSAHAQPRHPLTVVTPLAQTGTLEAWRKALAAQVTAREPSLAAARAATRAWWADSWRRSPIAIAPERPDENHRPWQIARNYQLFRYQLGCNARGGYPTKFKLRAPFQTIVDGRVAAGRIADLKASPASRRVDVEFPP